MEEEKKKKEEGKEEIKKDEKNESISISDESAVDKEEKENKKETKGKKKSDKNKLANLILAAAVLFAVGFFAGQQDFFNKEKRSYVSINDATEIAKNFISENLIQEGVELEVLSAKEEKGLYKITISVMDQEIETYITKDGEDFFPQVMNIKEIEEEIKAAEEANVEGAQAQQAEVPKSTKPVVETFVMSYCPYGTQIQKGLLPVINLLKDKIDFDFKFVDYAMHDKEEIDENLLQYCINELDQNKYYQYLGCFLSSGESDSCLTQVGINRAQAASCVSVVDAKYGVTKDFEDKENWGGNYPPFSVQQADNEKYQVQGSPTLVINGVIASSARDSQSLLATICDAFEEAPAECGQVLSGDTPTPGFGEGTTVSGTTAECG